VRACHLTVQHADPSRLSPHVLRKLGDIPKLEHCPHFLRKLANIPSMLHKLQHSQHVLRKLEDISHQLSKLIELF